MSNAGSVTADEEFGEGMVLTPPRLPGFWLPVDELFAVLDS